MARTTTRREILGLGLAAASSACCPCTVSTNYAWNNAIRTAGVDPKQIYEPASLGEIVELIRRAESEKVSIRMTGAGHSFSDVAMSEGFLCTPWKLASTLELDREQLKEHRRHDLLFRTESGIRLRHLNPKLEAEGLALMNMGGYDGQTIVGAVSTGTHGSGRDFGPLSAYVASLQIVTAGGEILQVEPADGITDPAKFPGQIVTRDGTHPAKLRQDDRLFNAVLISLGCMGIVYAVVLQVDRRFWLREVRELTTWKELKRSGGFIERLLSRQRLDAVAQEDPHHYEIYFNPYERNGNHACLLTKRWRMYDEPKQLSKDERKRGRWGAGLIEAMANITGRGDRLVDYFNANPAAAPASLDDALAALEDKSYVDVSYDVFTLGPANLMRMTGVELGFDIARTVEAVERHFAISAELQKDGIVHTSPVSVRFVKRSDALLAMMYGRDTMMLEIDNIVCTNGSDEMMTTFERKFMAELGARPHWGLDVNMLQDFEHVRRLYPAADQWYEVYKQLNARGTFNGLLTDRLGISVSWP